MAFPDTQDIFFFLAPHLRSGSGRARRACPETPDILPTPLNYPGAIRIMPAGTHCMWGAVPLESCLQAHCMWGAVPLESCLQALTVCGGPCH